MALFVDFVLWNNQGASKILKGIGSMSLIMTLLNILHRHTFANLKFSFVIGVN